MADVEVFSFESDASFFCMGCSEHKGKQPLMKVGHLKMHEQNPALIDMRGSQVVEGWVCPDCGETNIVSEI